MKNLFPFIILIISTQAFGTIRRVNNNPEIALVPGLVYANLSTALADVIDGEKKVLASMGIYLFGRGELGSALDNEIRPTIVCVITLAVNPYQPILIEEVVSARETQFGQAPHPGDQALDEKAKDEPFWTVGGTVSIEPPLQREDVRLTLVEQGLRVPLGEGGRFSIDSIRAGNYTLEIAVEDGETQHHKITVPAPDYMFEV